MDLSLRNLLRQRSRQSGVSRYLPSLPNTIMLCTNLPATATNWAFNFALAYAVPPMLNHIKYKTYFVFACFNAAAAIHMFLAAHETKRRTLEEMDDVFDSGLPAWKTSKITSQRLEQLAEEIAKGDKGREAEAEHVTRTAGAVELEKHV